jgi:hypothetical protein
MLASLLTSLPEQIAHHRGDRGAFGALLGVAQLSADVGLDHHQRLRGGLPPRHREPPLIQRRGKAVDVGLGGVEVTVVAVGGVTQLPKRIRVRDPRDDRLGDQLIQRGGGDAYAAAAGVSCVKPPRWILVRGGV